VTEEKTIMKRLLTILALLATVLPILAGLYNPPTTLSLEHGTTISSPSNGMVEINGAMVYTTDNPPPAGDGTTYTFDPIYIRQTGTRVTLADWLPNMVLANWFETRMRFAASSGGWEDGMAYVFDDQNGILTNRSSGYQWANPWYKNATQETAGLVAHYKMNDNAASVYVVDSVGSNHGTAQANTDTLTTPGVINGALTISEMPDYISLGEPPALDFGTNNFSVCAWVRVSSRVNIVVIAERYGYSDGHPGWFFDLGDNIPAIRYCIRWTEGRNQYTSVLPWTDDNEWHHVAFIRDGANARIYKDSIEETKLGAFSEQACATVAGYPTFIGASSRGYDGFTGAIDDVRFYSRAITSGEVAAIYADGQGTENDNETLFDMHLTSTNTPIDYTASNALWRAMVSVTNPVITTNEMRGYVVDLETETTNWCDGITLESTTDLNNKMWGASITNLSLGTNVAAGVWVSSNVSATVKGLGAIYAP